MLYIVTRYVTIVLLTRLGLVSPHATNQATFSRSNHANDDDSNHADDNISNDANNYN